MSPCRAIRFLALAWLLASAACSGDGSWTPGGMEWDPDSPAARAILAAPAPDEPLHPELAEAGERFYRNRGCLACHTLGRGDLVGPDLQRVVSRRSYAWFRGMVMNPDSMIRTDPDARALSERFPNPMPDPRVPELQVRAIWEFLRGVEREAERPEEGATPAVTPSL